MFRRVLFDEGKSASNNQDYEPLFRNLCGNDRSRNDSTKKSMNTDPLLILLSDRYKRNKDVFFSRINRYSCDNGCLVPCHFDFDNNIIIIIIANHNRLQLVLMHS